MALPWVAEAGFVALLLLVFVGLSPFEVRDATTLTAGTGAGSVARQICYLAVFAITLATAYDRRGLESVAVVPLSFLPLLLWCLASAAWALEPGVTVRRAGLEFVIVFSAHAEREHDRARARATAFALRAGGCPDRELDLDPDRARRPCIWRAKPIPASSATGAGSISTRTSPAPSPRSRPWSSSITPCADAAGSMSVLFVAALGFLVMTRSKSSHGLPARRPSSGRGLSLGLAARSRPADRHRRCSASVRRRRRGRSEPHRPDRTPSSEPRRVHRTHGDLAGGVRVHPRSRLARRGLRHLRRYRREFAAAALHRRQMGRDGLPRPQWLSAAHGDDRRRWLCARHARARRHAACRVLAARSRPFCRSRHCCLRSSHSLCCTISWSPTISKATGRPGSPSSP